MNEPNRFAPEGKLWVCCACGKTHTDLYGMDGQGSHGWDESCMLNACLYNLEDLVWNGNKVIEIREKTDEKDI